MVDTCPGVGKEVYPVGGLLTCPACSQTFSAETGKDEKQSIPIHG